MEVGRSFTYIVLGGVELCCCQLEVSLGRIVLSSWVALGSCLQHKWEQYQGLEVVLHGIEDEEKHRWKSWHLGFEKRV